MGGIETRVYRAKRSRTSFGPRGDEALRLMYQLGGMTVDQYERFGGTTRQNVYRILSGIASQGLTEQWPIATAGRPKDFHHLSKKDAGRAIVAGGVRAGVNRERDARSQWKLHQIPATAEHAHTRNEFYLALREAAERAEHAEAPLWEMWGESYPEFPLPGEGRPGAGERKNARMVYEPIYPDGIFTVRWSDRDLDGQFVVELEMRSRSQKVCSKLDAYAGRWLQLQEKSETPLGFDGFWPVLFVLPTIRRAEAMRQRVRESIASKSVEVSRYLRLVEKLKEQGAGAPAGGFVLFAGLDAVLEHGNALGAVWRPVVDYPPKYGGDQVGLRAVATMAARLKAVAAVEGGR